MRRVRAWLIIAALFVLVVKLLWWTVEPLIPWILVGVGLVSVYMLIFRRYG